MPKIAELAGDDNSGECSRTFVIEDENHTIGNVLKNIVGNYLEVGRDDKFLVHCQCLPMISQLVPILHQFLNVSSSSPDVQFCGYTIPHPQENKMHFRIQARQDVRAVDVLRRGLKDLEDICDHTITTFDESMTKYRNNHQ